MIKRLISRLLCTHYFQDHTDFTGVSLSRVGRKLVKCAKCGKVKEVDERYIDIKQIK